ncbi:3-dehydroquinate synthase [Bacillus sp. ISL-35]|uniref:3-dehydroquinate synthase n=1 Tax=Bacillus sp. ISL-35 TaxID=2819122 RepID=UPI001BE80DB3|nr:3-dehydroquinate synthase [Bacillus sp. ISL-35]MBT2677716.1 3-dehydroquinate synthase [Bacillus sp. ISL-35]MBT2704570.1 3-dehydroquinate synthase [Chryseobacterium sp. ISL-80]
MQQVNIVTSTNSYPVYIGSGAIHLLNDFIQKAADSYTSIMVITDETVAKHHLDSFRESAGLSRFIVKIVPSGEKAKTFDVYYDCLSYALENKLDRKSLIISLGGGAVGDLAGFVAASYMRGIRFIQVPTTILAHDSAVGGKVAVNHPLGKNMIGAFHQPEAVIYDLDYLETLPAHEVRSGFAEVIKHSLISDEIFYSWLQEQIQSLDAINESQMLEFLTKGISIKGAFVAEDEKEKGIRAYLNFGHTLGHAIEAEAGYGKVTHGEAVAIGMLFALGLSKELLGLDFNLDELKRWLIRLGYKTSIPKGLERERLIERMKQDKKSVSGTIRYVLLEKVGNPALIEVDERTLMTYLKKFEEEVGLDD